jgi:uncharacterized protein (TIGR02284 family)
MANAQTPGAPEPGEYAVQVLNTLIETTLDSADNAGKAAELARNPRFQALFREQAEKRRPLADELMDEVRKLGGKPWDKGSFRARTQRAFLELRDRLSGHSDKALIEEMERGEDFILRQFAEAAQDEALPPEIRSRIEGVRGTLQGEHDKISAIKREFDVTGA